MIRLILNILFCTLFYTATFAQVDYSDTFAQKLEDGQLVFISPVEGKYKDIFVQRNDYFKYDLAIQSRKKKLEIRYAIQPLNPDNPIHRHPRIKITQILSNVATNSQDAVIAVHNMEEKTLHEQFNADWGTIAYFTPKQAFSTKKHCKMLTIHSEGKANAFIFFLFNEPLDELETQMGGIRFLESGTEQ